MELYQLLGCLHFVSGFKRMAADYVQLFPLETKQASLNISRLRKIL